MWGTFGSMIPVLSAEQVRKADAHTITHEPIASIDLMERASQRCAQWLAVRFPLSAQPAFIALCGPGNNGGDGMAIAHALFTAGHTVRVITCLGDRPLSADAAVNRDRLARTAIEVIELPVGSPLPRIPENEVVLDALFGTGLDRPLAGWYKELVMAVNALPNPIVSIDLPSGLFAEDNSANDHKAIIQAEHVLTFEVPKLALLLPENGPYVGQWHRLPIGLDAAFIRGLGSKDLLVEQPDAHLLMPDRPRTGHKGTFGHALLVAGSEGKVGASILAARACARSGVGLITAQLPLDLQSAMHAALPEAMSLVDVFDKRTSADGPARFSAIGIGPGIGTGEETAGLLKRLVQDAAAPLVLDADALNILSENRTWLAFLPKGTLLTPHPKEFDRLTDKSNNGYERLAKARAFAVRFRCVLVLKGAHTATCSPDGTVYFNPTGNPGLAKGGSGDALTGILTGLLAQGLEPVSAAVLGVYVHGLAGDLAAEELGMDGMTPSDLIGHLPLAWRRIRASA